MRLGFASFSPALSVVLIAACSATERLPANKHEVVPPPALPQVAAPSAPVAQHLEARTDPASLPSSGPLVELPVSSSHARRKVWVRASFGKREEQLGKGRDEVGEYPPQGFAPTADGRLVVLDGWKERLVWFSAAGELERSAPLDIIARGPNSSLALLADGRIVVTTSSRGVVLSADGEKLPSPDFRYDGVGLHAVGTALFGSGDGMTEHKVAELGEDHATRGATYLGEGGEIPGHLMPDGTTVVSLDLQDREADTFWVAAVRGARGSVVFKRTYRASLLGGVPFVRSDEYGRIYLVLNWRAGLSLVCIDGRTGEAVGMMDLPFPRHMAEERQPYAVAPSGGLIAADALSKGITYEWFDCHPPRAHADH